MQSGVVRQSTKQFAHLAIAAGLHRVGQLPKAARRLRFDIDGVSKKFFDGLHFQLLVT